MREFFARVTGIAADALTAAGWHQHRREWRKRRGNIMNALATTTAAQGTWVTEELFNGIGKVSADVLDKAAKGDRTALPAVNAFLRNNPAAIALWGDIGRQTLLKVIQIYSSKDLMY